MGGKEGRKKKHELWAETDGRIGCAGPKGVLIRHVGIHRHSKSTFMYISKKKKMQILFVYFIFCHFFSYSGKMRIPNILTSICQINSDLLV